jgi:hypothetical protein
VATIRRYRWQLFGAIFVGLLAIAVLQAPRPISGKGVLYGHLWCIGIKFDDGSGYPVSFWPDGWRAEGYRGVVIDRAGEIVLREGERVAIKGKVVHDGGDGDTPCTYTEILTVEQVQRLPPAPGPSAGDSDG